MATRNFNFNLTHTDSNTESLRRILRELPTISARGNLDTVKVIFSRPLTVREAWKLATCGFSSPEEIDNNQTEFDLWFD